VPMPSVLRLAPRGVYSAGYLWGPQVLTDKFWPMQTAWTSGAKTQWVGILMLLYWPNDVGFNLDALSSVR
jgi:hypothetical protein